MKSQLILKDKTIYIGEIKNNKPHGRGVIQEDIAYKSTWIKRGIFKNGDFVKGQIKKSGKIVEGKFKKGNPIGKAKIIYKIYGSKRTSEYFGEIKKLKVHNYSPHGKGKLFTVYNGDISVGEFKNGLLIKGKIYYGQTKKWIKWPPKK